MTIDEGTRPVRHPHLYGPLTDDVDVEATIAELRSAGVARRALGVVDLRAMSGVERDPLSRWAFGAIGRDVLRTVLISFPFLVAINVVAFMVGLSDRPDVAVGLGIAAALGGVPVAALVGFGLAWGRWGHLTAHHPEARASTGYLVVTARR